MPRPTAADDLFPSDEEYDHRSKKQRREDSHSSYEDEQSKNKSEVKKRPRSECTRSMPLFEEIEEDRAKATSTRETGAHANTSTKSKKIKIRPVSKPTARELFGTDSEDEAEEAACASSSKKNAVIQSSLTRRLANGISRQTHLTKDGTHYVEVKVYKVTDIENVSAMNRWRHAVINLKYKTNDTTEAWRHLSKLISASRKEFKDCPPTFISNYY